MTQVLFGFALALVIVLVVKYGGQVLDAIVVDQCECEDDECPAHPGFDTCGAIASGTYRDTDEDELFRFCGDCGRDACADDTFELVG